MGKRFYTCHVCILFSHSLLGSLEFIAIRFSKRFAAYIYIDYLIEHEDNEIAIKKYYIKPQSFKIFAIILPTSVEGFSLYHE